MRLEIYNLKLSENVFVEGYFESEKYFVDIKDKISSEFKFLNEAKKNGWEVYGVEPSKNFVLYANEKLELNVELGTLEKANFPENFFENNLKLFL